MMTVDNDLGLKLNLGAGRHIVDGFLAVDLKDSGADVDLGLHPWPWAPRSVGEIIASHILEHFSKEGGISFLAECYRIMEHGALLHLAVPDMDLFIRARQTGDYSGVGGYRWRDLNYLLGGDESEEDPAQRHRYMYTFESLAYALERAGFHHITGRAPGRFDNPRYHAISLYVDAER